MGSAANHSNSSLFLLRSQFKIHILLSALHQESIHSLQRIHFKKKKKSSDHETQILPLQGKHTFPTAVYEKAGQAVRHYLKCLKKTDGMEEYLIQDIFGLII